MTFIDALNRKISGLFADNQLLEPHGPPPVDEPIIDLLPYRAYDEQSGLFVNRASCGFMLEVAPLTGATEETISLLTAAFSDNMPDKSSLQIMCWASPHVGGIFDDWCRARDTSPDIYRMLAGKRTDYFAGSGWKSPLADTAHLLRDFRIFVAGSLPGSLEKNKALLSATRRNLLGSMTGLGTPAKALGPDEFLAIMDEWLRPLKQDRREHPVWRSIDPLHHQLSHGENSISVHP